MTHEIRCVECGWLDPKLWSCYTQCSCSWYFRDPTPVEKSTFQLIFWANGGFGRDE